MLFLLLFLAEHSLLVTLTLLLFDLADDLLMLLMEFFYDTLGQRWALLILIHSPKVLCVLLNEIYLKKFLLGCIHTQLIQMSVLATARRLIHRLGFGLQFFSLLSIAFVQLIVVSNFAA